MEVSGQFHVPASLPPCTHWIGGWVGSRASQDGMVKIKNPIIAPAGNWIPVVS
jgi:hypothetical protein